MRDANVSAVQRSRGRPPHAEARRDVMCQGERRVAAQPERARAHKTSKLFGCASTELNVTCAEWLDRYLALAVVPSGGYIFHADGDPSTALEPWAWTRLVQRAFYEHSGVKLCPKDLREPPYARRPARCVRDSEAPS